MHGIVTSYQQVASSAAAPRRGSSRDAFVIFDELHHAADDRAWGAAIRQAFGGAAPPARALGHAVPLRHARDPVRRLRRRRGRARLRVRLRRRARGPRASCGPSTSRARTAAWSGRRPTARSTRRPSTTALDAARGEPAAAHGAVARGRVAADACCARRTRGSREVRREQPNAGGLVIATDQEHARGHRRRCCGRASARRRASSPRTTRSARPGSPRSPRGRTRGSSRCAWSRRASTSRACASASTRRRRRPSSSSARRSAASCAGRAACRASARGSSSRTTRGCACMRPASPSSAATRCAATRRTEPERDEATRAARARRADVALRRHLGGRDGRDASARRRRPRRARRPR